MMRQQYGTTPLGPGEYREDDVAPARPKDAATLIVVRAGSEPRILMGKRAAGHRFMPNKFVFPGGRLDLIDQRLRVPGNLSKPVMHRLRKATREAVTDCKLRGLALAAIRETFEETGLIVGEPATQRVRTRHPVWRSYLDEGAEPPLQHMDFIARAITPAYHSRRFDTRFFLVHDQFIHNDPELISDVSGELNELHWLSLDAARRLDLPSVTRWVIDLVEQRVKLTPAEQLKQPAPFVRFTRGRANTIDL
jgi:8-oxo-dGTP pyrophosphatase MutT (NUDIX family)